MGTSQGKPEQEEMQMQEISREEVRAFYDGFPEDEIRRMRGRVAEFCRRALDAEPSVKEVDDALFEMGRRLLEFAAALDEELEASGIKRAERLQRERYEREREAYRERLIRRRNRIPVSGRGRGDNPDIEHPPSPSRSKARVGSRWTNKTGPLRFGSDLATIRRMAKRRQREGGRGRLPDFLILGAQKCGTSSLYHLLGGHPDVEPSKKKEVHYFDVNFRKGADWYRARFPPPARRGGRPVLTGESSPYYLYHPHAPSRAAGLVPEAKLFVLLRNPVDRAYSHYRAALRHGRDSLGFEEALEAEMERLRGETERMLADGGYVSPEHQRFSYLAKGVYVDQLVRWSAFFGRDRMLVLKSEDFFERPWEALGRALDFLGLPDWQPDTWEVRNRGDYEQGMDPATRRRLEAYFRPHNKMLYELLGEDFGW